MNAHFANWLKIQMYERNWSQTDLARASGLNKQSIYYYLKKSSKPPHAHVLAKIAYALELPVEQVYRAAGFLSRPPHVSETMEQVVYEMENMPEQDQQEVLAFIHMKNDLRRRRKK